MGRRLTCGRVLPTKVFLYGQPPGGTTREGALAEGAAALTVRSPGRPSQGLLPATGSARVGSGLPGWLLDGNSDEPEAYVDVAV